MRSSLFIKGKPFIMAPQEVISDSELTDRGRRVLLALLAWVKKGTNQARISRQMMSDLTGLPKTRISEVMARLVKIGWVTVHGKGGRGRWNLYEIHIPERLKNGYQTSNVSERVNESQYGAPAVTETVSYVVTGTVTPIDTEIYTEIHTDRDDACERFLQAYPIKSHAKEIKRDWNKFDKESHVSHNIDMILDDIEQRIKNDWAWLHGRAPSPLSYLKGERWNDDIRPVAINDSQIKPDWAKLPYADEDLPGFAQKNGFSKAKPGQDYFEYRSVLKSEIEKRLNSHDVDSS